MGRKNRKLEPDATYHVTSEVNRSAFDLIEDEFKAMLLTVLIEAKVKYRFTLFNFCILSNHFHLLIKPENGVSLSKIMQWIKTMSAKRWNKVHGVTGHLWGKRFWSQIVRGDNGFVVVCKYIDDNPVKAGLVKKAEDWVFGGLYHHRQGIEGVVDALKERILERLPQHRHVSSIIPGTPLRRNG
jgi:putative transposase